MDQSNILFALAQIGEMMAHSEGFIFAALHKKDGTAQILDPGDVTDDELLQIVLGLLSSCRARPRIVCTCERCARARPVFDQIIATIIGKCDDYGQRIH
jgi:hypothetical protein